MKKIVFPILAISIVSFTVLLFLSKSTHFEEFSTPSMPFLSTSLAAIEDKSQSQYKFVNSTLAFKILSQLDLLNKAIKNEKASGLGLIHDNEYCENHRAYFTEHPEFIFEEMNFVSNMPHENIIKSKMIPLVGKDLHPKVGPHMSEKELNNPTQELKTNANIFALRWSIDGLTVGQHYSCLSQISNHIPGVGWLVNKDLVAKAANKYAKQYQDRPQCFNFNKIFPKTWILYEKEDCLNFFKEFNSPEYEELKKERGIVYISKVARNAHRAEGVTPVQESEENRLRYIYDNGKKCGKNKLQHIVQNYIHNTLLLNGHRFDFRIYMLIASTNPLIAYYHDGIVRFTVSTYDTSSTDKKDLLPNAAVDDKIYNVVKEGGLYEGMGDEELRRAHRKSYEELQTLLLESGATSDPNWIDNHLRPEIKKAMVHLLRMTSKSYEKHSSLYELHGLDFVIDRDLNLWFIEANASPALAKFSIPMERFITKMLSDHYEIVFGLLRSRMKRVINYVNELIETGEAKELEEGKLIMNGLKEKIEKFENITKNYFEKEFEPSSGNGFVLIVDGNKEGVERYQGLVSQECL